VSKSLDADMNLPGAPGKKHGFRGGRRRSKEGNTMTSIGPRAQGKSFKRGIDRKFLAELPGCTSFMECCLL
jgi:hypothetical protein